jgi:hypothetical protein
MTVPDQITAGAGALALVKGMDFDPVEEGLARPVLDPEHADGRAVGGGHRPAARVELAGARLAPHLLVPSAVAVT